MSGKYKKALNNLTIATYDGDGYLLADKLCLEEAICKAKKYDELVKELEEKKQKEQELGIEMNVIINVLKNGLVLQMGESGMGGTWVKEFSSEDILYMTRNCFVLNMGFNTSKQKNDLRFVYFKDYKKEWWLYE